MANIYEGCLPPRPKTEDSVHLVAQTSPLAGLAEMLSFSQLEGELSKLFTGKLTLVLGLFKKVLHCLPKEIVRSFQLCFTRMTLMY